MAKNGSSFEYYYSGGSMKIIGENGYYAGGGRTSKKRKLTFSDLYPQIVLAVMKDINVSKAKAESIVDKNEYLLIDLIDNETTNVKILADIITTTDGGEFGDGGRTGKKRLKRKKVTRQNPNYDRKADSGLVAKPQGHRFTDKLAKRLGKPSYAKPTQEQIEKYRGKGVYSENRQDKSDVKPNRNYPSLGDGGMMFGKGGSIELKKFNSPKMTSSGDLSFVKEDKKGTRKFLSYNTAMSEIDKFQGTYEIEPNYNSKSKEFSYKIIDKKGDTLYTYTQKVLMDKGGRTGKKRLKRKKVTRQNPNYDKKADSGLVAKPQGHRFTDKLAKRLGKPSYAKPTQEQIDKYRGKGVYSENRQDKSDVKPNRNYPSL
jgi:hypothetical protein